LLLCFVASGGRSEGQGRRARRHREADAWRAGKQQQQQHHHHHHHHHLSFTLYHHQQQQQQSFNRIITSKTNDEQVHFADDPLGQALDKRAVRDTEKFATKKKEKKPAKVDVRSLSLSGCLLLLLLLLLFCLTIVVVNIIVVLMIVIVVDDD
jgi:hypothetical protein